MTVEKKKNCVGDSKAAGATKPGAQWASERERQIYYSALVDSLRRLRGTEMEPPLQVRAFREEADGALAVAGRGRTRWSRAMLPSPRRRRARPNARAPVEEVGRVELLGRVVPGCRGLPLPCLLDEVVDYVGALEMQVEAMTALVGALQTSVSSGAAAAAALNGGPLELSADRDSRGFSAGGGDE